jgi:hypothetical protein
MYGRWRMSAGMPGGGASNGEILDFSNTGVFFVSPFRYEADSTVELTIWFTPTSSVRCKARIVRDGTWGDGQFVFGACYDDMSPQDHRLLQQMVLDLRREELRDHGKAAMPASVPCAG